MAVVGSVFLVRLARLVTRLVTSGLALLAAAMVHSYGTAHAATGTLPDDVSAYRYTDKPSAAAMGVRILTVYVDRDFNAAAREHIGLALQQWNHVLNGFVQLRPALLPSDPSDRMLAQLRRSGAWIVLKVDSRHPAARDRIAMAVTIAGLA